jgi:hypothetical protein
MLKPRARTRKLIAGRVAKAVSPVREVAGARHQVCIGTLVEWDDKGPLVDFDGNRRGPVRARLSGTSGRMRPVRPGLNAEVGLLVDGRSGRPPILLGILQPLMADSNVTDVEALVDGRRVDVEGREEIVLRCGAASITLRRNGRILIRGVQVETRATGVNRVRGGTVAIN